METYSLVHSAVATPSVTPDMMRMLWSQYGIDTVSERRANSFSTYGTHEE